MKRSPRFGGVTLKAMVIMPSPRCSPKRSAPAATRIAEGLSADIDSLISLSPLDNEQARVLSWKGMTCPFACSDPRFVIISSQAQLHRGVCQDFCVNGLLGPLRFGRRYQ